MNKLHIFKVVLFLLGLITLPGLVHAQYSLEYVGGTARISLLVGSLPPDNDANAAKLQIDVFGGGWGSNNTGVTTYYVGNRGGIVIHQVTNGNATSSFTIKAYANPNGNTDIYIVSTQDWPAFSVKSCKLGNGGQSQLQTITSQTPTGTDITPAILPVLITDANGNIAINTFDSKGYKFAVNGSAVATSVTVKLNNVWPDYVFKPSYQLPSLSEVKTYIDQHQHLPEIPSEQEIAKDGQNLGEMNKLLLKKVEELTLYLIEKDRKEKELEGRLKAIEQQLKK
ncbi:hypothetical protein FHW88_000475 [Mucilaginibacter sp. SG538B]|uniref:hypothetical protein n=1 Tax=Mucilaginibacter sp. SG538B TaxID=2587021 RepID=UPI00159E3CB6|nr:hypothetical protein [Mucilaginibacter sp. SG538B]NVM62199.1 hypothetical protein [Mucilaginibacter sp. SG538B]